MLSVEQIKPILAMVRIENLSVRFEPESRRICAEFDRGGQHYTELISFEDIESIFTDRASTPAAVPGAAKG